MGINRKLAFAGSLLLFLMVVSVTGYLIMGGPDVTLLDAVYMAVITFAGVGYGEVIDTTHNIPLRVFNTIVVGAGWLSMIYIVSSVTAFLVEGEIFNTFRRRKMQKSISDLKYHFIVCGLGDTGRHAVEELLKTHTPFVVVESHEDNIARLREQDPHFANILYLIGDATDDQTLEQAGLMRAKGIIAALSADKDNLVITVMVRQKNPHIRIVARFTDPKYTEKLIKAGANSTVSPNRIGGLRMASEVLRPHVVGFLDLMLKEQSKTLRLEEIDVSAKSPWAGKTLAELQINQRFSILVLAVKSASESRGARFFANPPADHKLDPKEVLVVMGDVHDILRARQEALHDEAFLLATQD
jgi:voltage-gated potassium channel